MTETMADGRASAAACMLSPRIFTNLTPSSNLHEQNCSNYADMLGMMEHKS
jgi:hypothetical protein